MPAKEITHQCLTEREVSSRTGLSLSTLRAHRFKRKGLPYIKIGRSVRYRAQDLETFFLEHSIDHSGNS